MLLSPGRVPRVRDRRPIRDDWARGWRLDWGVRNFRVSASITVFDTDDGSVRLIAGLLGGEMLSFRSAILD